MLAIEVPINQTRGSEISGGHASKHATILDPQGPSTQVTKPDELRVSFPNSPIIKVELGNVL